MRYAYAFCFLVAVSNLPALAAVDQELLGLVPPGAKVVTGVDVNQAKNSPFGQYVLAKIDVQDRSFEDLIQETGFDPRRDLQDFVFATPGSTAGSAESKFVLIVRGTFDQARIRTSAKAKGAVIQNYQGVDMFVGGSDPRNAFTFVGDGVAVMGDVASVQQVITNRRNPAPLDPTIDRLVGSVGAHNDMWFVSVLPGSYLASHVKQESNQPVPSQALDSILQSSGGIQFGDAVRISFDAVARSAKDAQSVSDVIRFFGSMVQMGRQKNPAFDALASAVDQMTLQTDGDAVHASISLPEKSLEQLADLGIGVNGPRHSLKHR